MIRRKTALLLLHFLTICSAAFSQQKLSLEQCRQLAFDNNKSLKAATEQEQVAHYQKKEALMQFFPKISASGMYMHFNEDVHLLSQGLIPQGIQLPAALGGITIPIPDEIRGSIYNAATIDLSNVWVAGAALTQPVFAGGKIIAYNDLRAYAEDLAKTMKESKMADIIVETDEAYWQAVSLTNKTKLAGAYVELLKKMYDDIVALQAEGLATKADMLSVNVKLNEAELNLTKAENGLSLAKMLLCEICGIEINQTISLADEAIDSQETAAIIPTAFDLNEAIGNRPETRSLQLVVNIAEQQKKIAFADYLPTIGLMTGYTWMSPNFYNGTQYNMGGNWNIGVAMKLPLNFITNSAKHSAAKSQKRIREYELESAKEKMRLQISQSEYKLAEANKKMEAAIRNVEKADENLRYAKAGFDEGVIPAADVLAAHTAWMAVQNEKIDALIDQKLCAVYLNKALGKIPTPQNK